MRGATIVVSGALLLFHAAAAQLAPQALPPTASAAAQGPPSEARAKDLVKEY